MIDEALQSNIDETRDKHQFITFFVLTNGNWKCGVVQNGSTRYIAFYDFAKIEEESRGKFIKLADQWWWESGMTLPLDTYVRKIFGKRFKQEFQEFYPALTMIHRRYLAMEPIGPVFSLTENYIKRIKKKRRELLKI